MGFLGRHAPRSKRKRKGAKRDRSLRLRRGEEVGGLPMTEAQTDERSESA